MNKEELDTLETKWKQKVYALYGHGGIRKRYYELIELDLQDMESQK